MYVCIYIYIPQLKKKWGGGGPCKLINGATYAGQQVQCNLSGLRMALFPQGYTGHVAIACVAPGVSVPSHGTSNYM